MAFLLTMHVVLLAQSAVEQQLASAARQRESIQVQQASVRKQIKLAPPVQASFFVTTDDVKPTDCAIVSPFDASRLAASAAQNAGIDVNLLQAVVAQESAWKPCAVSPKGAMGLAQLMPVTAADLGVADPFDPAQNLAGGAALLKQLIVRYGGDLNRVLGAYNAGPARVDAANGVPAIPETLDYVEKIMGTLSGPAR